MNPLFYGITIPYLLFQSISIFVPYIRLLVLSAFSPPVISFNKILISTYFVFIRKYKTIDKRNFIYYNNYTKAILDRSNAP